MLIKIIIYGILMLVSGYCIFKIEHIIHRMSLVEDIEDSLDYNEHIVCEDAIVVQNENGEISWYDAKREYLRDIDDKPKKNTKDTHK